jgi:iron complex outermembrane receptor protein
MLLSGAALALFTVPSAPALAQQAAPTVAAPPADTGEIVVTAQRRSEKLRDVPLSVTALSGATLKAAGIQTGLSLGQVTPGLNFQANGSTIQPAIRGVTSTGSNPGDAANVAIYVDGVYQPVQFSNFLNLVDVQQIEVLKGPQGTLFGRNATGGAITVTTRTPQYNPTALFTIGYGRFHEVTAQAFVSGGLTDTLAASLAADYHEDDGFRRDLVTRADLAKSRVATIRGKLLFEPTEALHITLSGDYNDSNDNTTFSGQPLDGNTVAASLPGAVVATKPNTAALNTVPVLHSKGGGGSLKVLYHLPFADLSSLTAYRTYTSLQIPDSDVTNIPLSLSRLNYDTKTWSQEFNLTSTTRGPIHWIAGVFLFDDKESLLLRSFTGATNTQVLLNDVDPITTKSAAIFGELTYDVTRRLSIIGGLRYNYDHIDYKGGNNGAPFVSPPAGKFNSVTPRASVRYAIAPTTNVYFTYSKGFKAGVFATSTPSATVPPVRPEKITAYEAGVKGKLGQHFSYSAAYFHYDYRDLQFQAFGATSLVAVLQNAANARIDGAELDGTFSPIAGVTLSGGLSYVDGKYVDFPGAQGFIPKPAGGNTAVTVDASGNRLIRTPKWSGNVSANYTVPVGSSKIILSGNMFFSGTVYYDVTNRTRQKPYQVLNLTATWQLPGDHLELQLFGTNVTGETYINSLLVSGLADNVNYARPASYGARFTYRY